MNDFVLGVLIGSILQVLSFVAGYCFEKINESK